MTDYIMNDPKLTHDGRFVKQGFSDPENAPTGQFLSENARITQKATTLMVSFVLTVLLSLTLLTLETIFLRTTSSR